MELLPIPLATFAFVTSITPGPNNIMLAASGVHFGFARTLPHLLGVSVGFGVLALLCALGVGALVVAAPVAYFILKMFGSAYLLVYAWRLRALSFDAQATGAGTPMSFGAAALFQFVNPKAWVMGVTSAAAFMPAMQPVAAAAVALAAVYVVVNLPCIAAWAALGASLRRSLREERWRRLFSGVLVALTVYSAASIWM
jgi:threonine/homoserine/homoserine lactone efflux protein